MEWRFSFEKRDATGRFPRSDVHRRGMECPVYVDSGRPRAPENVADLDWKSQTERLTLTLALPAPSPRRLRSPPRASGSPGGGAWWGDAARRQVIASHQSFVEA